MADENIVTALIDEERQESLGVKPTTLRMIAKGMLDPPLREAISSVLDGHDSAFWLDAARDASVEARAMGADPMEVLHEVCKTSDPAPTNIIARARYDDK